MLRRLSNITCLQHGHLATSNVLQAQARDKLQHYLQWPHSVSQWQQCTLQCTALANMTHILLCPTPRNDDGEQAMNETGRNLIHRAAVLAQASRHRHTYRFSAWQIPCKSGQQNKCWVPTTHTDGSASKTRNSQRLDKSGAPDRHACTYH